MFRWMLAGAGLLLILVVIAAYAVVTFGLFPANADGRASALERWAAHTSLDATIAREAGHAPNPLPLTDENLEAGIKLYATNCMVCHGASDGESSNIASGLYQHPPRFGLFGREHDPDGDIYWTIQHGIRLTGMPSFSDALTPTQIWQLTLFLKNMHELPPGPDALWKKQPSQAGTAKQEPEFMGPPQHGPPGAS